MQKTSRIFAAICEQTGQIKLYCYFYIYFFIIVILFTDNTTLVLSKMCVHRYKKVARFGLMHMASTNLCVWFRSIVVETLHEIHAHGHHGDHDSHDSHDSHGSQDDHASHDSDHGASALANFSTSTIPDKIMAVGRKLHAGRTRVLGL